MGVSGGLNVFRRFREGWNRWPLVRSTSSRDGKGAVRFASTDEVLTVVYRPNLSVRVSFFILSCKVMLIGWLSLCLSIFHANI